MLLNLANKNCPSKPSTYLSNKRVHQKDKNPIDHHYKEISMAWSRLLKREFMIQRKQIPKKKKNYQDSQPKELKVRLNKKKK